MLLSNVEFLEDELGLRLVLFDIVKAAYITVVAAFFY